MMKKLCIMCFLLLCGHVLVCQEKSEFVYLFTAHTYMGESTIDNRLEELNKDTYDNIWLGGDICSETLMRRENLDYLHTHLRIGDPHNYFTLGNHDRRNGNLEWFEQFIGKKSYYADYYNNLTVIVLDTNLDISDCENLNNQFKMISKVTDTISVSSHLILLFHWGLWDDIPGLPPPGNYCHGGLKYWNSNCDSTNNNFAASIYPKLVDVKNRGIEVVCIMGDMGASYKKTEMYSTDSIVFLGCGLDNIKYYWEPEQWWTKEKDVIMEIYHNVETGILTWQYKDLDSLLDVQNGYKYLTKISFDDFQNYPAENIVFVQHQNYAYSLNQQNEQLIVYENTVGDVFFQSDSINFNMVIRSVSSEGSIKIVFQIINDSDVVEERILNFDNVSNTFQYLNESVNFDSEILSNYRLKVFVENTSTSQVLLNNVILKYYFVH